VSGDDIVEATSEALGVIMDLQEELQQVRLNHITTIGELHTAFAEIERLRTAGDALAKKIDHLSDSRNTNALVKAWQEARRER
jgi:hemoglobin-like flavoprotein